MLQSVLSALVGGAVTSAAWIVATRRTKSPTSAPAPPIPSAPIFPAASPPPPTDSASPGPTPVARVVPMPHPDWAPGKKQPTPFSSNVWTAYDPSKEEKSAVYPLVISVFVPRPIALVSSCNSAGDINVAPYSYFNAMGHNPVTLCIGINRSPGRGGGKKDTLINIEETGEFVVNIMSEWYVEAANHTCGDYDTEVDEMALTGLTPIPSQLVRPPRIGESAIHMECKLKQVVDVHDASGKPTVGIVIGEVVMFHIHEAVQAKTPTGKMVVDPIKLQPISRLGGTMYGRTTELFNIGRPTANESLLGPVQYTRPS